MSQPLRIGIIGCGRILPAHLRGFRLLKEAGFENFRIVALAARKLDDAKMFAKRGEGPTPRPPVGDHPGDPLSAPHIYVSDIHDDVDVKCYDDWKLMLEEAELDAVSITLPVHLHHEVAVEAINRGIHCMVEKPLAVSVRTGRHIVDAAREKGVRVSVMEVRRFAETTRAMETIIRGGDLGDIQMVAQFRIGTADWSPDWVIANTPWRHDKLVAGGGASMDMGVHFINEIRSVCGEVKAVQAITRTFEKERRMKDGGDKVSCNVDDTFFAHYELESGAIGQTTFSWAGHGEPTALQDRIVIYGTRGCIKGERLVLSNGSEFDIHDYARQKVSGFDDKYFPRGIRDTFALTYLDWLQAIEANEEPEMSGKEALLDLAVAFAINESSLAEAKINVRDVLEGKVDHYQREIDERYAYVQ